MHWKKDLTFHEINKVEMVDAWTQTSNHDTDNEARDDKIEVSQNSDSLSINKNIDSSSFPSTMIDSPLSMFK